MVNYILVNLYCKHYKIKKILFLKEFWKKKKPSQEKNVPICKITFFLDLTNFANSSFFIFLLRDLFFFIQILLFFEPLEDVNSGNILGI